MYDRTKKIICFIPFLNFVVIGFKWFQMYFHNSIPKKRFLKNILIWFMLCIAISIPEIVLDNLINIDITSTIINLIVSYLYMLSFSLIALNDQIKYYEHNIK